MRSLASGLVVLCAVACGNAPAPATDGGLSDAAIEVCLEPDRACPADEPFPGSPCEGMLECDYGASRYVCVAGEWSWQSLCDGGCAPPLVEACGDPFSGSIAGATLLVGPDEAGPFRPFSENEHVMAIHGPQGGSMLAYRLRISGAEGTPVCVSTTTTVAYDGRAPVALDGDVTFHCGRTLRIYYILPDDDRPCEFREYPLTLEVEAVGIGSVSVPLVIDGGSCPR